MRVRWLRLAVGMLLAAAVLLGCASTGGVETANVGASSDSADDPSGAPVKGNPNAPVTLVVFCDFV